jgi:hypothetical protein
LIATIEIVTEIAWKDMEMVVPHLLSTSGLVVLSERRTVATISGPQWQRDPLTYNLDRREHCIGNVIDVLVVIVRNNQYVTSIRRPPCR